MKLTTSHIFFAGTIFVLSTGAFAWKSGLFAKQKPTTSITDTKSVSPSLTPELTTILTQDPTSTPTKKIYSKRPTATPTNTSSSGSSGSSGSSSSSNSSSDSNSNSSSTPAPTPDPCTSMTNTSYDQTILNDTPVLYLPLENNTTCDHSGNRYDGGGMRGTNLSTTTLPNGDTALVFNGVDNYIATGDRDAYSISTTGKLTIEAWMKPSVLEFTNKEGSGYVYWMGKGNPGNYEYALRMYSLTNTENRPNRISGYAFNSTGGLGVGSYFQDTVNTTDWNYVTLVVNTVDTDSTYPMGYTKIYKNGVQRDKDSLASLSITPTNGSAPFSIGSRDYNSFFAGAIGKVAIYNYELSPYKILGHYQKMVPPVAGTASFVQNVGKFSTKTAGTTMQIPVQNTVKAGDTLIVRVVTDYTSGAPTVADSKGNTYTRDRTAPSSGNTIRASIYSSPITSQLTSGDTITITSSNIATRSAVVDEFSGLLTSSYLDQQNGTTNTSTTPGTTISITTTQANELVLGYTAVEGPIDDTYTEDNLGQFSSLTREGTTGDVDDSNVTNNAAYKSVGQTGTYQYKPTLDPSRKWILFILSYKAL